MKIDVKHVADLARLKLSEDEMRRLEKDLESILLRMERLKALDVEGVEPTFGAGDVQRLVLDQDRPAPGLPREEVLKLAPSSEGPYVSVPREGTPGDAPQGSE
ncbi:MAG TPA: Asp-tRNA(Asn)/Glu-tRNA(Gln) amidotransferase subunit GatC [Firmicutes bacterium]|nr:Asp-tRNA(Asn)/Glu-tRNA(Gln) amidotransferase subunit GatC [Candidatus Fermentithermobacillaceae bacterium]